MQNSLFIFTICVLTQFSSANICAYNFSLTTLPNPIINEVIELVLGHAINELTDCATVAYSGQNINFWLYTRNNPSVPIKLFSNDTTILKGKKTILLNHGFLCTYRNDLQPELKDAYLARYDANVVMVDWSFYSVDYYANCYCNIPRIAETTAELLCKADSDLNINITQIHVLGHSMGGQLAGLTGQKVQEKCNKTIKRVSALDPAGPLYNGVDKSKRLDASDAKEVMVCHSNQGIMGYFGNCGTVDYYPDMGVYQNGCSIFNSPASNLIDIMAYPVGCSHLRCVSYMIESISSNKFIGKKCLGCSSCTSNLFTRKYGIMGEDYTADQPFCSYYMNVNDKSPFAQG